MGVCAPLLVHALLAALAICPPPLAFAALLSLFTAAGCVVPCCCPPLLPPFSRSTLELPITCCTFLIPLKSCGHYSRRRASARQVSSHG